ncbi:hypothetical protein [Limnoglobus roseus]|uniref:Uncharacterized protein n=1 Tax=Limnoglobus roseus TaxID=2598579 RepID=A0A5C1ADH2_9BACT|nr:hypothetical protein [Limnoglobus roseus]QEL16685.1 hypothetical protein PX52LOC_03648 [Limnoglobus roseus]
MIAVLALLLTAVTLAVGGWFIGHWWGLAISVVLGVLLLGVGLTAATMLYAMTQDWA